MTGIATGVFKQVNYKRQTGLGVVATGGATGTSLRRTTSTLALAKKTYKSAEILPSQQRRDMRHGVRNVAGAINGELSVGGYQNFMESICRQIVQAAITTGAVITITSAVTTGAQGTYTRSAGSYLSDGFKIGDVINCTGWAAPALANNNHYAIILSLTATVMTVQFLDGNAMVAKAAGDSVTIVQVGKKTWIPVTGQTRDYYTIEHWQSDIAQDDLFTDCVIDKMSIKAPPTGMTTVTFDVMGLNETQGTAAYFTSPAAAPTGGIEASVNGIIIVNGVAVAVITAFNFDVTGNYVAPGGVVGSNVDPDIFPGVVDVTGSMSVLYLDDTFKGFFRNETEFSIAVVLTANNSANSPFTSFVLPRVKATGATTDDKETGLTTTVPFTALENFAGGANLANLDTTLSIQDSAFA